jgi:hypothetical protein
VALAAVLLLLQDPTASVSGTVRLGHRVPPRRVIRVGADPRAEVLYPKGLESDELLVGRDDGIAAALVTVKDARPVPVPPGGPVNVAFQGFRLLPRVVTIRPREQLILRNGDNTLHNYHVLAYLNKETNVGLPAAGFTVSRKFDVREVGVKAKCDVHPWEISWIHVLDHPFHSSTDSDGRFSIRGLPPGRHTLVVWHERCKPREIEVELRAGETRTLDVDLETHEGPPPFPWLKVGVGGGAVLFLALGGLLLVGRRPRSRGAGVV